MFLSTSKLITCCFGVAAAVGLFLPVLQGSRSKGGGVFYFEIIRYENNLSRLDDGGNCDDFSTKCDPYFSICISSEHRLRACDIILDRTKTFDQISVVDDSLHREILGNPRWKPLNYPTPRQVNVVIDVGDRDRLKTEVIGNWMQLVEVPTFPNKSVTSAQVPPFELTSRTFSNKKRNNDVKLIIKVYTVCLKNVFGRFCEIFCEPTEKFTCNNEGHKVCRSGWKGDNCDEVDHCVVSPCAKGAVCVLRGDGRACYCHAGEGPECYPNFCTTKPCQNGGTCHPLNNTCLCVSPFYGPLCQHWRNLCLNNPCVNNGTCLQQANGQMLCLCPQDFEGTYCELIADATSTASILPKPVILDDYGFVHKTWFWAVVVSVFIIALVLVSLFSIYYRHSKRNKKFLPRPPIVRIDNADALNEYETPVIQESYYVEANPMRSPTSLPPSQFYYPAKSPPCSSPAPSSSTYMPMTLMNNNVYITNDSPYEECEREDAYQLPMGLDEEESHYVIADNGPLPHKEDDHRHREFPLPPLPNGTKS